jgi:uncharacterized protein
MEVEWDPLKAASNRKKHGIAFADGATVLDDPFGLTIEDKRFGEQRFVTVGSDALSRILVVVYVYLRTQTRFGYYRRRATASEKRQYHGENEAAF